MIEIREADLSSDRDVLISSMLAYLSKRADARRFTWLYRQNPPGPVQAWVAIEPGQSRIIGSGAVVPQRVAVDGRLAPVAVMADFWIHPDFRSMGPALQLQRRCMEAAEASHEGFFDLPQRQMIAVYRRLGIPSRSTLVRLAKPLRSEAHLHKLLRSATLARLVAPLPDAGLVLADRFLHGRSGALVAVHTGPFDAEFTALSLDNAASFGACVARSAEYLNWRYHQHYFLRHEVFTARAAGRLLAYAIIVRSADGAAIVDLFGQPDREVITDLLLGASAVLRRQGVATLSIELTGSHRLLGHVEAAGFRRRQERPLIIHASPQAPLRAAGEVRWSLSQGDLEH